MSNKESLSKTVLVAFSVCLVCAIFVSGAAVVLKPMQERNQLVDVQRNVLSAAGLLQEGVSIEEQFEIIETRVVDLRTGVFSTEIDPTTFDQFKAAKSGDPDISTSFDELDDPDSVKIGSREDYSVVYIVRDGSEIDKLILPVRGYGLWSTLYGFIALDSNLNTVSGLGFYQHGETPGLGGEVDNVEWKQIWIGKEVYNADGDVALSVIKGQVDDSRDGSEHQVDGLSGATLTSKGVHNLVQFWMGKSGYGPFLTNLKEGEA